MLQLIQAFRYEHLENSELKNFFFKRVFETIEIANSFHWLVHLDKENELNDPEIQEKYTDLYEEFIDTCAANYLSYYQSIELQL